MPKIVSTTDFQTNPEAILKFDPLVGDSACQLRPPYLFFLYQKAKKEKLSDDEILFLKNCDILTQSKEEKRNDFDLISSQKTKNQKGIFIIKCSVAQTSIDFLFNFLGLNKAFFPDSGEEDFFKKTYTIGEEGKKGIPYIMFYASAKLMIYYAIKENIPIIVNLKKINIDSQNNPYTPIGASTLLYRFDETSKNFIFIEESESNPIGITFDIYSCNNQEKTPPTNISPAFYSKSMDEFINEFKKIPIELIILICASGHEQFKNKSTSNEEIQSYGIGEKENTPTSIRFFKEPLITLESIRIDNLCCTIREFEELRNLAKSCGLIDAILYEKEGLTKNIIPFQIDHVYISRFNDCVEKTKKLLIKNKLLENTTHNSILTINASEKI